MLSRPICCRRLVITLLGAFLLTACAAIAPVRALADNAPMWDSPVGLAPGNPNSHVQMLAEAVDIQVVERPAQPSEWGAPNALDVEIYALVDATFTMQNNGPDILMKVGFPGDTSSAMTREILADSYSPITFGPALTSFRVQVDGIDYRVSEQEVVVDASYSSYGSRWYVWEMAFPRGRTQQVRVSYEQQLHTWTGPYAQPMYILRTGAFWDGPIGEATVTMVAPNGGAFVGGAQLAGYHDENGQPVTIPPISTVMGADQAAERSETRLVWRLRDFTPTQDVGTTYVVASRWQALLEAEAAAAGPNPSGDDYTRAARAALQVHGAGGPRGLPQGILDRVPLERTREWARQAVLRSPQSAAAWLVYGDMESSVAYPDRKHHGEFACWPGTAADAYRRALALGSPEASDRLGELYDSRAAGMQFAASSEESPWAPCPGASVADPGPEIIAAEHIEVANRLWAYALNDSYGYIVAALDYVYGGAWLAQVRDLVRADESAMRVRGERREAHPVGLLTIRTARVDARGRIEALVSETWNDQVVDNRSGAVVRRFPGQVEQQYILERSVACGCWLIVESQLTRRD
jgi:hypothetical protein